LNESFNEKNDENLLLCPNDIKTKYVLPKKKIKKDEIITYKRLHTQV
jgi:hypothetical protein